MRWSKLKQLIEDRFADDVKARVSINMTRYRKAHDEVGEVWFTIDAQRVYSASYGKFIKEQYELSNTYLSSGASPHLAQSATSTKLQALGIASDDGIVCDLRDSLNMSVNELINHSAPFIRALAIMDKRFGKRRLAALNVEREHDVVKRAYLLRAEA